MNNGPTMGKSDPPTAETADQVAPKFFGVDSEPARRPRIGQVLLGAGLCPGLQQLPETGELITVLRFTAQFLE